jgi:hypothetical protein
MEAQGHYRSMRYRAFSMGCGGAGQIQRWRLDDCYQSSFQSYQVNAAQGVAYSTHSSLSPYHSPFIIKLSIIRKQRSIGSVPKP